MKYKRIRVTKADLEKLLVEARAENAFLKRELEHAKEMNSLLRDTNPFVRSTNSAGGAAPFMIAVERITDSLAHTVQFIQTLRKP